MSYPPIMEGAKGLVRANLHEYQQFEQTLEMYLEPVTDLIYTTVCIAPRTNHHKLLVCGNGGSAAQADHLVAELTVRFKDDRRALPAISLVNGTPSITACGNDYGWSRTFEHQVEALGRAGDILIAFSTSGTSDNVIKAINQARNQGMRIIGISGARGMNTQCDIDVRVPSKVTSCIQEMHLMFVHQLCTALDTLLR